MAKLTPSQMARNCSRGLFPQHEAVMRVIELVGQFGVDEILPNVSEELLSNVRYDVNHAPTTEEGWANVRWIIGGTFAKDYDHASEEQKWRASYQHGVEALKRFFKNAEQSLD